MSTWLENSIFHLQTPANESTFYLAPSQTIYFSLPCRPFRFVTTTYATSGISRCVLRDGIFQATFGAAQSVFRRTLPSIWWMSEPTRDSTDGTCRSRLFVQHSKAPGEECALLEQDRISVTYDWALWTSHKFESRQDEAFHPIPTLIYNQPTRDVAKLGLEFHSFDTMIQTTLETRVYRQAVACSVTATYHHIFIFGYYSIYAVQISS